jgi:hypothetical protein
MAGRGAARRETLFMKGLQERKHLVLFLLLIVLLVVQPMTSDFLAGEVLYDGLMTLTMITVFVIIFTRNRERLVTLPIVLVAFAGTWVAYVLTGELREGALLLSHALFIVFCTLAIAVILRDLFKEKVIQFDHVIGAFCGYLLVGVVWGNCYLMMELLSPGSFRIAEEIAWQLEQVHTRRFLFNYFSFVSLTTMGYGDISPVHPGACSLVWLEGVFGQFYVAVIVAQLIGLKLAQAVTQTNPKPE